MNEFSDESPLNRYALVGLPINTWPLLVRREQVEAWYEEQGQRSNQLQRVLMKANSQIKELEEEIRHIRDECLRMLDKRSSGVLPADVERLLQDIISSARRLRR